MILELDLGNTRAKWRLIERGASGALIAQGAADIESWLAGLFPEVWTDAIENIRIASVLAPAIEDEFRIRLSAKLAVPCQFTISTASCGGVSNAYSAPERLGVDRWLGMIAAYNKCGRAVMVIDVGTALKVDVVDRAGKHLGGYIVPGAALMERALLEGTDRVRYEAGKHLQNLMLGDDTRSCVQNGIAAALLGAVLVAIQQSERLLGEAPAIFITGGLGLALKERLLDVNIRDTRFEPDLVLDGLRWALD